MENPSATIVLGLTESVIVVAGPTVCVRSAGLLDPEASLAITVDVPTVVELVKVAVATPSAPVTALPGVIVCSRSLEANVTVSPATGRCAPWVTVAVTVVVSVRLARIVLRESDTVIVVASALAVPTSGQIQKMLVRASRPNSARTAVRRCLFRTT